jgi:hypothetical protein
VTAANPSASVNDAQGIYVANNFDLPFHQRIDIFVGPDIKTFASVRFGMPDMVVLRKGGLSPRACDSSCTVACTLRFQVQAFHEQDSVSISYEAARADAGRSNQLGYHKCHEHLSSTGTVLTDASAATTPLTFFAARCPASYRAPIPTPGLAVTFAGAASFPVDTANIWQASIIATCIGCYGGASGQVPVDFLVRVQDSTSDPNPPIATYNGTVIPGLAPAASRAAPISVTCGRTGFTFGARAPTSTVRVAYYDPDDGLAIKCVSSPNSIASISPANSFPPGVVLSALTRVGPYAYLDVQWTPRCEDVAQVRPRPSRRAGPAESVSIRRGRIRTGVSLMDGRYRIRTDPPPPLPISIDFSF